MDTGAIITTVGSVITGILVFLGIVYTKRAEKSAKLSENRDRQKEKEADHSAQLLREYLDDARFSAELAGAAIDDYLSVIDWAAAMNEKWTEKWHTLINGLPQVCKGDEVAVRDLMTEVDNLGDLPPRPTPRYRELQRQRREALRDAARRSTPG